jgi:hypothetical protein
MLIKLNEKDKKGKDLYQNAFIGEITTLSNANFSPSIRQINRHFNDKPRQNNRKSNGEQFVQTITFFNKKTKKVETKSILHYTNTALARKEAVAKARYKI